MPEDMTEELKHCPFCGGEAEVRPYTQTSIFVQCKECMAATTAFESEAQAITAWNKRYTVRIRVKRWLIEWLQS